MVQHSSAPTVVAFQAGDHELALKPFFNSQIKLYQKVTILICICNGLNFTL